MVRGNDNAPANSRRRSQRAARPHAPEARPRRPAPPRPPGSPRGRELCRGPSLTTAQARAASVGRLEAADCRHFGARGFAAFV
ncbi:unnamed protein product [Rangifer tarandus platyrhynchus]|uniref:Uncharacterized protein n=2 Tax=Rangifer tarandus platyrhynchus TaxID=3082113 RepID=A0ABN8ZTL2_RANTA|nr:unnamed protein product [Rangifer tarandus platyrhynchus]CAI9711033.1 unnamed protein product [Rangifer tarandus platyrhynchus]